MKSKSKAIPNGRKQPERMCASCRRRYSRRDLIRFTGREQGDWHPDLTGKEQGRGIYLCRSAECLARMLDDKKKLPFKPSLEGVELIKQLLRGTKSVKAEVKMNTTAGIQAGSEERTVEE